MATTKGKAKLYASNLQTHYREARNKVNLFPRTHTDIGPCLIHTRDQGSDLLHALIDALPPHSNAYQYASLLKEKHQAYERSLEAPRLRQALLYPQWAYHPDSTRPTTIVAQHKEEVGTILEDLVKLSDALTDSIVVTPPSAVHVDSDSQYENKGKYHRTKGALNRNDR